MQYMQQLVATSEITSLLKEVRTIAIVGLSPKESRPSNVVARYLQQAGFTIVPVNPGQEEILGEKCYPDLSSIPEPVDVVDVFRRADQVVPIAEDAVKIGAKALWLQQGIRNDDAAAIAGRAGLTVVMDRCIKIDHQRLIGNTSPTSTI
jgi:predicted CoA-binding protein